MALPLTVTHRNPHTAGYCTSEIIERTNTSFYLTNSFMVLHNSHAIPLNSQSFVRVTCTAQPFSVGSVPCLRVLVNLCSGPSEWVECILRQEALLPALLPLCDVHNAHRTVVKV